MAAGRITKRATSSSSPKDSSVRTENDSTEWSKIRQAPLVDIKRASNSPNGKRALLSDLHNQYQRVEYLAMDEDLAKTYVEENLMAGENSTGGRAFVEEYLTMNEVTEKFIKEYVISRIRDNLTSIAVSIKDFGHLVVTTLE
jgi:hypothetical protein